MSRPKEQIDKCMSETIDTIHKFRNSRIRKYQLIPIEEEIIRTRAYCTIYYVAESSKALGIKKNTYSTWLRSRGIKY